ncbi:MAG TPA: UDP-glucose 4-epimerase GalE [Burkholderiaceae bacterium]|nr:UDP-glucose 4-epimerase GalE [Burkholderiaceae bacterium]
MKLLVTGGAGFVGAALVKLLQGRGHTVTAFDNLSSGSRIALESDHLVVGDLRDREAITAVLRDRKIDAVMHLAAPPGGMRTLDASSCYANSVLATHTLLDAMVEQRVRSLVFASSAQVYGMPVRVPIDEEHPKAATDLNGTTKWMCEQMLEHWRVAYGLQSVALRWYGTAGADLQSQVGPSRTHDGELIPRVMRACSGRGDAMPMHGIDHATRDGTCVRDFLHVNDVCEAFVLALDALQANRTRAAYNIGTGRGYSIREVVLATERVTQRQVPVRIAPRRPGDVPVLVTDASAARYELGWKPRMSDIDSIIEHAWHWEERRREHHEFQCAA